MPVWQVDSLRKEVVAAQDPHMEMHGQETFFFLMISTLLFLCVLHSLSKWMNEVCLKRGVLSWVDGLVSCPW